MGRTSWGGKGK
ncbi:hypothetical protein E2C01_077618 [Portunus trituberculatus]|uniref:Uncharacterized protein n=1 Tax=Portunus trituberculatus TaxID=210409 RepID=A0A5B7ILT6_PORTR|nr:hypothetical protein [Portunus trituberculatus]